MDRRIRGVLSAQTVWVLLATLLAYRIWNGSHLAMVSAAVGAFIALVNTAFIAWRLSAQENLGKAPGSKHDLAAAMKNDTAAPEAHRHLKQFYRSALERYLLVAGLFAVSLGVFAFLPLAVLGGFILGQALWIAAPLMSKEP